MVNSERNDEVSDTTDDAQGTCLPAGRLKLVTKNKNR